MSNNDNNDNDEIFDLTPHIGSATNLFKIIHLYNRSDTYHLTRQVLLDSMLRQNTYCFFYHILFKNIDEFNEMYGSFACLISRSAIEADLYLNVDSQALYHIICYIQTTKIDGDEIYLTNGKIVDEIIELAVIFGMPLLVSTMRQIQPTDSQIADHIVVFRSKIKLFIQNYFPWILGYLQIHDQIQIHIDNCIDDYINQNKDQIIKYTLKKNSKNMEYLCRSIINIIMCVMCNNNRSQEINEKTVDVR